MPLVVLGLVCLAVVVLGGWFVLRRRRPVCDVCGNPVEPDAPYCPVCGADFTNPDREYHRLS